MINHKKVHRLYCLENLRIRTKKRKKIRTELRVLPPYPTRLNQIWTMDFMHDQLMDGRSIRVLNLIDKLSREALIVHADYRLSGHDVVSRLEKLRALRGVPEIICVDNGSEFTSKAVDEWAYINGVKIHFIKPGKPTENAHIEAFNRRFRDECLDVTVFKDIQHAREEMESWKTEYNNWRPHSSLGNLTPREFARRKSLKNAA